MAEPDEAMRRVSGDLREETKVDVRVIRLSRERLGEAAGLLARCFHTNPNFVDLFPEEGARSRTLPRMFAAGLRDALGFGHVYAATRQAGNSIGDELAGVAVWLPPGAFPLSATRQLRALPGMGSVLAAAPSAVRRLLRYTAGIAKLHPAQPNWYLEAVGVDSVVRGLGIGTRLLEPVLGVADETGQRRYLETMTERNVGWYRNLGFEVREAGVRFVPGGQPNSTMIRHPLRDRAGRDRESRGSGRAREEKRGEPRVAHDDRYPAAHGSLPLDPLTRCVPQGTQKKPAG
jgi:GNAT superfamily N-acetyltransferase